MNSITTFDLNKEALLDLLRGTAQGKIQLPDFQRNWIWNDEQVKSLLASVSLAYPIGIVLFLQVGGSRIQFKPRLIEGVHLESPSQAVWLVLDGQQRLTSLFQALLSGKPVLTHDANRSRSIKRWYYIDIDKALNYSAAEREEAILSLPESRVSRRQNGHCSIDCSTSAREYEQNLFPIAQIFNYSQWRAGYCQYYNYDKVKLQLLDSFENDIIKRFEYYQVPVIELRQELSKEAICQVFEIVNTSGKELTLFDLLTASYAAENFALRDDWLQRGKHFQQRPVLKELQSTDFLFAVNLVARYARRLQAIQLGTSPDKVPLFNCRRKDILGLSLEEYQAWAGPVMQGFESAARLLHSQKIYDARDLPYMMQVVALAAFFTVLGKQAQQEQVRRKLIRWYWCGVLSELYRGSIVWRVARDLLEVVEWVNGGDEPGTVCEANFLPSRLFQLKHRSSAAYRGMYTLLLQEGARDFYTGEPITDSRYFDEQIDSHHIFPQDWFRLQRFNTRNSNCIVNRTPLSSRTNREIGSRSPSEYLSRLERDGGFSRKRLDEILSSHLIDPTPLRVDDFELFFTTRTQALLELVSQAMGKSIAYEPSVIEDGGIGAA